MTGRTEGHLDEQARGDAVSLNILSAETPSGQLQRRVGPQLKVGGRGIEPTQLGFLRRGSILVPEEPGGVAGPRSNGKCQLGQLYGREKTRGMNLLHACQGIGQFLAPLVVGACLAATGKWRVAFLVSAACYSCASLTVLLRLKGPMPPSVTTQENQSQPEIAGGVLSVAIIIGIVGFFFLSGGEGAITSWTPAFLETEANMPKQSVLLGYALMMAGCTLIRLLVGFKLVRITSPFMVLTAVVYALSFAVFVSTRSALLTYLFLFLLGMAFGSYWPSAAAAIYDAAPRAHGRLTGLIVVISTSGGFVFISGVGWLGDRIGLGPGLWAAPAGACLFVLLFVIFRRLAGVSRSPLTPTSCS